MAVNFPRRSGRAPQRAEMFHSLSDRMPIKDGDVAAAVKRCADGYKEVRDLVQRLDRDTTRTEGAKLVAAAKVARTKVVPLVEGLDAALQRAEEGAAAIRAQQAEIYNPTNKSYETCMRHAEIKSSFGMMVLKLTGSDHIFILSMYQPSRWGLIHILEDKSAAALTFNFLDWRDGFHVSMTVLRVTPQGPAQKARKKQWLYWQIANERPRPVGVQLSGTVKGVNQMRELRDVPFQEPVTATITVASIILSLLIGLVFSISYIFRWSRLVALTGTYAAPALAFALCCGFVWAAIYFWHFRFFPNRTYWFRHEGDSELLHALENVRAEIKKIHLEETAK